MENQLELRAYRKGDLRAMYEMDLACFPENFHFDLRSMKRFAEARNAIVLLAGRDAQDGSAPLGFVIVHTERAGAERYGYVVTLDVLPEERRSGVAGALMDAAERQVRESGALWMALHVHTANLVAVRFYERRGYVRVRVQTGFYGEKDGRSVDAFVYRKELGSA